MVVTVTLTPSKEEIRVINPSIQITSESNCLKITRYKDTITLYKCRPLNTKIKNVDSYDESSFTIPINIAKELLPSELLKHLNLETDEKSHSIH